MGQAAVFTQEYCERLSCMQLLRRRKPLQAWTGSLLDEVDNVTVIERRLIHVPPFFLFFFFNTPKRRKTDAVRGAGASLLLTRPICVLGKNVLSVHVLTGTWKGKKKKQPLPTMVCAQDQMAVRACVRA